MFHGWRSFDHLRAGRLSACHQSSGSSFGPSLLELGADLVGEDFTGIAEIPLLGLGPAGLGGEACTGAKGGSGVSTPGFNTFCCFREAVVAIVLGLSAGASGGSLLSATGASLAEFL